LILNALFNMYQTTLRAKLKTFSGFLLIVLTLFSSSCSTKKIVYFDGINNVTIKSKFPPNIESLIQINDLLSITVSSANPTASAIFNAPNESTPTTSSATSFGNTLTVGYLVNLNGDILFPVLGKIHAQGLTKSQLQGLLTKQLVDSKQLIDPIVTIRQLNFRVSVLGEVAKPGVYTTPNEKISFLEALSFAGDITIYGKKDNVLLVREDDKGDKLIVRIDLTSSNLFTSPYYYLKSNDIIYVEPSQNREKKERFAQVTPIILSVVSLLIITISAIEYRK
ncbi:MAG: polysaccharide biosynthesis/export family protein, partial [Puia sp.]